MVALSSSGLRRRSATVCHHSSDRPRTARTGSREVRRAWSRVRPCLGTWGCRTRLRCRRRSRRCNGAPGQATRRRAQWTPGASRRIRTSGASPGYDYAPESGAHLLLCLRLPNGSLYGRLEGLQKRGECSAFASNPPLVPNRCHGSGFHGKSHEPDREAPSQPICDKLPTSCGTTITCG